MACCGQTAAQALAAGLRVMDERIGAQTHVKIVYTGAEIRTKAYVTGGNVFQFGNNDRRRVNIVPARAVGFFLSEQSPNYGQFALWDPALFAEDGTSIVQATVDPGQATVDPGQAGKGKKGAAPPA